MIKIKPTKENLKQKFRLYGLVMISPQKSGHLE